MAEEKQAQDRSSLDGRHGPYGVHLPLPYQSLAPDGTLLDVNDHWLTMLGYERDEVIGRWFGDFVGEEYRDLFRERFENFKCIGHVENADFRVLRKDGGSVIAVVNGLSETDDEGNFVRTHCLIYDASEARAIGQAYETLVENSIQGLVLLDRQRVLFANQALERMSGYSVDELRGFSTDRIRQLLHPEDQERVWETLARGVTGEQRAKWAEFRFIRKDGSVGHAAALGSPVEYMGKVAVQVAIEDLTEERQVKAELVVSQSRLAAIVDSSPDFVLMLDRDLRIRFANRAAPGLTFDDLYGTHIFDFLSDADREAAERVLLDAAQTGQSGGYETTYGTPDGSTIHFESRVEPIRGSAEGAIEGLVLVARDITARVEAESIVLAERDKAQQYLDVAGVMFVAIDSKGRVTLVNQRGCELLGAKESEIVGRDWFRSFVPKHMRKSVRAVFDQLMSGEIAPVEHYENPVVCSDGTERLMAWHNTLLRDEGGTIIGTLSSGEDITERRRAADALRDSEERYRGLIETLDEGIWEIDVDANATFVNPRMAEMLGCTVDEMLGKHLFDFMDEKGVQIAQENLARRQEGIGEQHDFEFLRKDGSRVYAVLSTTSLHDSKGNYAGALAGVTDITRRRVAERAVQESEKRLRETLEATTDGIWTWDFETDSMSFSPRYYTMLGYEPDAFPSDFDHWLDLIHPDDLEAALAVASEYLETKPDEYHNQFRLRTAGGEYCWIRAHGRVVERDKTGAAVRMIGNHEDVTERVLAQRALQDSETRLRLLFEQSAVGIALVRPDGSFEQVNDRLCKIVGYDESELLERTFRDITFPEDLDMEEPFIAQVLAGEIDAFEVEKRYIHKDGHTVWIRLFSNAVRDQATGCIEYAIAAVADITERREAQLGLERSLREWEETFDASNDAIWLLDANHRITRCNLGAERLFGMPREKQLGRHCWTLVHGTDGPIDECPILRAEQSLRREMLELERGNRWHEVVVDPVVRDDGSYAGAVHTIRDVTAERLAERALRESEERFRVIAKASREDIWQLDREGNVTFVSPAVKDVFGYSEGEALGLGFDAFFAPEEIPRATEAFAKALAGEEYQLLEFRGLKKDGSEFALEVSVTPVFEDGEVSGVQGIARDISDRKRAEAELRKLAAVVEHTDELVNLATLDGQMVFLNEAGGRMLGIDPRRVQDVNIMEIIPESHAELVSSELLPALMSGGHGRASYNTGTWSLEASQMCVR